MSAGTMKQPIPGKDFRFIKPDEGDKDVFSHRESYVGVNMDDLQEGDKVSFDVEQSEKGPRAVNIKKV